MKKQGKHGVCKPSHPVMTGFIAKMEKWRDRTKYLNMIWIQAYMEICIQAKKNMRYLVLLKQVRIIKQMHLN